MYRIKHKQAKLNKISALVKQPDIEDQILIIINEGKSHLIEKEDEEAIKAIQYAREHRKKKATA